MNLSSHFKQHHGAAPELQVSTWLNTNRTPSLASERGKVVVIEAFQMLCPGCVSHGIPLAMRIHTAFSREDVSVLGLHSVFEHHEAQGTRAALEAFLHEYRVTFPVAIDAPSASAIPATMAAYGLEGTPSLALIDRQGILRLRHFGQLPDLVAGALIMELVTEHQSSAPEVSEQEPSGPQVNPRCTDAGCSVP